MWQYDAYGNLLTDGITTYTYDAAMRLISVTDGVSTSTFVYNGDGDLVSVTILDLTTTTIRDWASPEKPALVEVTGADVTYNLYGLGLVAQQLPGGEVQYLLTDGIRSMRQIVDGQGNVTATQTFDPYGGVYSATGTGQTDYGFMGLLGLEGSPLLYANGQWYHTGIGRFISPVPGLPNPYVPPLGLGVGLIGVGLLLNPRLRRKKGWRLLLMLMVVGSVGTILVACDGEEQTPTPTPPPTTTPSPTPTPSLTPTPAGKTVYLTFDDGPDPFYTPQLATYLYERGVQATFFVTGDDRNSPWGRIRSICTPGDQDLVSIGSVEGRSVLELIDSYGFGIGLHGWFHGYPEGDRWQDFWNHSYFDFELNIVHQHETMLAMGMTPDPLLRAPGGQFSPEPFPDPYGNWYYYGWDVTSGDSGLGQSPQQIVNNVVSQLSASLDDPIILFHSTNPNTLEAFVNYDLLGEILNLGYVGFDKLPRPGDHRGYPPNSGNWSTNLLE